MITAMTSGPVPEPRMRYRCLVVALVYPLASVVPLAYATSAGPLVTITRVNCELEHRQHHSDGKEYGHRQRGLQRQMVWCQPRTGPERQRHHRDCRYGEQRAASVLAHATLLAN